MKHTSKVSTRLLCVVLFCLFGSSATAQTASRMYWTDSATGKIQRAKLDGTGVEDLITGLPNPVVIALDLAGGKMYWSDGRTAEIQRANLNGSDVEVLVGFRAGGIALDLAGGKMYWTETLVTGGIQRANLDGSGVETLVTLVRDRQGIALDVEGGKMYWTDRSFGRIERANLDGTAVQNLVTTGLSDPRRIALDLAGGKMYWTDAGADKIQRANLDGSGVEDLVTTGLGNPQGIALDLAGGKMYWTDFGTHKIQRANLDGSGVEDLVTTGLAIPAAIALELEEVLRVAIDIKRKTETNAINPANRGLIPVAILTTENFDAATVSPSTVQFGPGGASMAHRSGHLEDVDSDGDLDLLLHFRTPEAGIQCGDTEASLTGETFDGQSIQGLDSIVTVGCSADSIQVDQFQLDGSEQNQAISGNFLGSRGQSFTVGKSGLLHAIELSLFEIGSGGDLTVTILDLSGGDLSTAPILGSVAVPESAIGRAPTMLTLARVTATLIDLSSLNLNVNEGDVLAFRLSSVRELPNLYAVRTAIFSDLYAGGAFFARNVFLAVGDMAFKTFIAVPEPDQADIVATSNQGNLVGIDLDAGTARLIGATTFASPPT